MRSTKQIEKNTTASNIGVIEECGFELSESDGETVWRSLTEGNGPITCWTEVLDGVLHLAIGDADGVAHGYIPAAAAVAMVIEGDREHSTTIRWA